MGWAIGRAGPWGGRGEGRGEEKHAKKPLGDVGGKTKKKGGGVQKTKQKTYMGAPKEEIGRAAWRERVYPCV